MIRSAVRLTEWYVWRKHTRLMEMWLSCGMIMDWKVFIVTTNTRCVVKAGDALGLTGRTGRATTEHLHLEFRIDGQPFNPNLIFDMKDRTLRKTEIVCTKAGNGVIVKPKLTPKK